MLLIENVILNLYEVKFYLNKYHDSSYDTCFAYLGISKDNNSPNLFYISRCSVGLPVDSLDWFIPMVESRVSGDHIVLDDEVHSKRYLFTQVIALTYLLLHYSIIIIILK